MTTPEPALRDRIADAIRDTMTQTSTDAAAAGTVSLISWSQLADAVLPVVEAALAEQQKRAAASWVNADYWRQRGKAAEVRVQETLARAEQAEAKVAALMDERGAEEIERIQAERAAMPRDERARRDAADAPMLRIQLAGMARQVAETKAEMERTSTAAAREIWVKMGFDTILMWKQRAEQAEAAVQCVRTLALRARHAAVDSWHLDITGTPSPAMVPADDILTALDQPEVTP